VCAFIRGRFRFKKVGHAGTLDPLATGLLVVLIGRATKQSSALTLSDKEYFGIMELGVKTDSHDRHGKVIQTAPWQSLTLEAIRRKALEFTGEIIQTPPMVSALKHKGVRLYELARKGVEVPREGRKITVYRLDIESQDGAFVKFSASVSKGTYLRTLVNDLGEALGCFAALSELRRIRSGLFTIDQSVTIDQLKASDFSIFRERLIPLESLSHYASSSRD
jgi:tRNA pseudouridine55 synthase